MKHEQKRGSRGVDAADLDTRAITKRLREVGSLNGEPLGVPSRPGPTPMGGGREKGRGGWGSEGMGFCAPIGGAGETWN